VVVLSKQKLTIKQKAFADYYIELGNATQAAIKAGYNKKSARQIGTENLTKPSILAYIEKRLKPIEDKRIANADRVLEFLTGIMNGDQKEKILVGVGLGEQTLVETEVTMTHRVKAAELLGKRHGLWRDKIDLDASIGVTIIDDVD